MKRISRFTSRRIICAILGACYGILAVIATSPHPHDRSPLIAAAAAEGRGIIPAAVAPASVTPPVEQTVSGPCHLCSWGRSTTCPCLVYMLRAVTETTASARVVSDTRVTDNLPAGNVLLRAPPAI